MKKKLAGIFETLKRAIMLDGDREENKEGMDVFTSFVYTELTLHMEPLPSGMDFNSGSQVEFEALGETFFLSSNGDIEMVSVQSENDFEVYEIDDKRMYEAIVKFLEWRVATIKDADL